MPQKNKYKSHTIKGKALYLVIFISFVVSVILLLFIAGSHYNQVEILQYRQLKNLILNTNSAIQYGMSTSKKDEYSSWKVFEDSDSSQIKTNLKIERWGAFYLTSAKSSWKDMSYSKTALLGAYLFIDEKTGLYLADKGKYLSVAGDSKLSGTTYLPPLGIRSVYIDGIPFKGRDLVEGIEKTSEKKLPGINPQLTQWVEEAYNNSPGDSAGYVSDLVQKEEIIQPLTGNSLFFKSTETIKLKNIQIEGKVIIHSDSLIYINRSAQLKGVILISPVILIDEGFNGSIQAFASDSVVIAENCALKYPSLVAVYNSAGSSSYCYIGSQTSIQGGVFSTAKLKDGADARLILESESEIHGIAYASGKTSLEGTIYGSMYANTFFLKTKRGYYENHLLNAQVIPDVQLEKFLVPDLLETNNTYNAIEWH
jgi:hypothetical protein